MRAAPRSARTARTFRPSAQRRRLRAATSTSGSSGMAARGAGPESAPAAVAGDQLRVLGAEGDEAHAGAAETARDAVADDHAARRDLLAPSRAARTPASTSLRRDDELPRGRLIVIPDGVMSSAWQSWTLRPIAFLTANTAGTRSACRRSSGARRRSAAHGFILGAPAGSAKKRISSHFSGWASSTMKFGMSSTTRIGQLARRRIRTPTRPSAASAAPCTWGRPGCR